MKTWRLEIMNKANQPHRIPDSRPRSVMESIGVLPGHELEDTIPGIVEFDAPTQLDSPPPTLRINPGTSIPNHPSTPNPGTTPSLDETSADDILETTIESAKQVQQLAHRLKQNELHLIRRATDLNRQVTIWERNSREQQNDLEDRISHVKQQSSQVRCQQLNLMQLQTDIIKSHEATRQAVESLATQPDSTLTATAALQTLKYELGGRFDYITRRWEHLLNLMRDQRAQAVFHESIDDSINWQPDALPISSR